MCVGVCVCVLGNMICVPSKPEIYFLLLISSWHSLFLFLFFSPLSVVVLNIRIS